jgi:hypothetical protein
MEKSLIEAVGKKAYETHVGIPVDNTDRYFVLEVCEWKDLPASTREHWKKIALSVIDMFENCDCGDLV